MYHFYIVLTCVLHVIGVRADCPHEAALPRWSDPSTWPGNVKPSPNTDVTITGSVLYDEPALEMGRIDIEVGGSLVFDPSLDIHLRTTKIFINGSLHIGSEDCPYTGQLRITLIGTSSSTRGDTDPKGIIVNNAATLEIHGEPKLSWTKITQSVVPLADTDDLTFEHSTFNPSNPSIPYDDWTDRAFINGIAAYTIRCDVDGNPVIKAFSEYELVKEGSQLAARIEAVQDGEILMLASQKTIRLKDFGSEQDIAFDALETLLFGEITNTSKLRQVSTSSTYALVYQKAGDDSHYVEVSGAKGEDSIARLITMKQDLVFEAFTLGGNKPPQQVDNFRILKYNGLFPLVHTVDDVTSWSSGDTVVIASTDYDWTQAEERTIITCLDCDNNQFRIDSPTQYVHWGEFMHVAVDMRAEVGVITRNVVIEGEMENSCPPSNGNCDKTEVMGLDTFGGHIKIIGFGGTYHIENARLFHLGQQTETGRYPVHAHMNQDSITSPYVRDCTIHKSFAHCVVMHATHDVTVMNNFCYDHMGHGFLLEDGAELNNTLEGNLVIGTRKGTGDLEPSEQSQPTSFWITNPNNRVINNVAAGGDGTGFWFIYPDLPLEPSTSLNIMDRFEARSTIIMEFYNNVGHSNSWIGVQIGSRLNDNRGIIPQGTWQPRANPKDPSSTPLEFTLEKVTGYKNRRNNVWVEAGKANLTHVSVSDSLNGVTLTNDGLVDMFTGRLMESVVVGDSVNIGVPSVIPERSVPLDTRIDDPHSGLTLWKGPTKVSDLWFGGSYESDHYDTAAIAMKRFSPYFISVQQPLSNLLFTSDDERNGALRAISGLQGVDPGWKSRDGALMAGFTLITNETAFPATVNYVVRPDHLSAADRTCRVRSEWRFALCTTKYGNIKMSSSREAVFVRDDLPSAQLEFTMSGQLGPQVVLDGSKVYTVHFPSKIPGKLSLKGEGMERGDVLLVGVCLPRGGGYLLKSNTPVRIKPDEFVAVSSMDELKRSTSDDGRKYYYDDVNGMLYYKFVDSREKDANEMNTCKDGACPELIIDKIKGDKSDADCRLRVYGADLEMPLPELRKFDGIIPANGESTPPPGWGAGSTRPFTNRDPVDGGYGDWSEWSSCSKTCDEGIQYRRRMCNDPIPRNGGSMCAGNSTEVRPCLVLYCPIDGDFSLWSEWSECHIRSENECQGKAIRTRTCSNPTPQYNGEDCDGSVEEQMSCNNCADSS